MTTSLPFPLVVVGDPGGESVDAWGVQRDLEALAGADIDTGGQALRLRCGTAGPITAGAGVTFTVAHGLGTTPVAVVASSLGWAGFLGNQAPDAVNLNLFANVNLVGNYVMWIAIG